jgi:PIN domain nuclease of toxin-antitoxin system
LILLDTHALLWLALDPSRLSRNAHAAISEAQKSSARLAICDVSMLEISTAFQKGRIAFRTSLDLFLAEVETRFVILPITAAACTCAASFPSSYPNDPADRIIGATAVVKNLQLITADRAIRESNVVKTIW